MNEFIQILKFIKAQTGDFIFELSKIKNKGKSSAVQATDIPIAKRK